MDLLDIVPVDEAIEGLSGTPEGRDYLETIRAINAQYPDFFTNLIKIGGFCNYNGPSEFEQGNQWALTKIAAQVAFAVKFNGVSPQEEENENE